MDADGYINKKTSKKGVGLRAQIGSVNKELALQEMCLIQSLGFNAKLYEIHYDNENKDKTAYRVEFGAFKDLFKMRYNSLKCVIIFVFRKQVLCHYFNELSFFVVYKVNLCKFCMGALFHLMLKLVKGYALSMDYMVYLFLIKLLLVIMLLLCIKLR